MALVGTVRTFGASVPLTLGVRRPMTSAKYCIDYVRSWRAAPMAYWVHIEQDGKPWYEAEVFLPPAPQLIPHKGYRVICLELAGVCLRFTSLTQMEELIRVLSMKTLPTSRRQSEIRGKGYGPNGHWLSRLPSSLKSPRNRSRVVAQVKEVLAELQAPNPSIERTRPGKPRRATHVKR